MFRRDKEESARFFARILGLRYDAPSAHFAAVQVNEALLLKCFDSRADGSGRFAPHTAFIDPTAPSNAAPRESIEVRTLVFHRS